MKDEVSCVVEDLLKQPFSCRDSAYKKTIEID
jgi:hypothetical protein